MKEELGKIIDVMSTKIQGVKWVHSGIVHCTMKFFGDVEEDLLMGKISQTIEEELKNQAPFKLKGVGIGVFPNWRYPRVIWAGLVGDTETATSLYQRLETALENFPLKKDSRKTFRLHLTLGRAKSKLKDVSSLVTFVEKQVDRAFGDFEVDHLTLYKSVLTKEGPIYTPLKEFKFGNH
jgi:2'-5' RNA ligase